MKVRPTKDCLAILIPLLFFATSLLSQEETKLHAVYFFGNLADIENSKEFIQSLKTTFSNIKTPFTLIANGDLVNGKTDTIPDPEQLQNIYALADLVEGFPNEELTIVPIETKLDLDFRDSKGLPCWGARLLLEYHNGSILNMDNDNYGIAKGSMEYYLSTNAKHPLTAGFRARGALSHGDEGSQGWRSGYGFFLVPLSGNLTVSLSAGFSDEESIYPVLSVGRPLR